MWRALVARADALGAFMAEAHLQRPYQAEAIQAVHSAWSSGVNRTLLVMATGTGKTYTFCRILTLRRDQGFGRALVLAHRIELIDQAIEACERAGLTAEAETGDRLASTHGGLYGRSDVVVATVQSLRGRRLDRWHETAFGTVVVDECHHSTAASYRAVLDRFPLARVIGVTATPDRGDKIGLGGVFGHVAYQYDLRTAIADGWLCPIRVQALTAGELDLDSVRVSKQEHGRDLHAGDIAAQLDTDETLLALGAQIVEAIGKRPTVVFTPSVLMAHRLAGVLTHLGLATHAIDGTTPRPDRAATLAGLADGSLQCVASCGVLTEGWDCPVISAVVVLRPTKSRALYAQMIGRGTRNAPGKVDCLVCDLTANSDDHTLVTPLDCLGGKPLPDDVRKLAQAAMADGDDLETAIAKAEAEAERKEELRRAKLARKAKTRIKAKARYESRDVDPFRSWCAAQGKDAGQMREHSPLAFAVDKLLNAGVDVPPNVTREQCDRWLGAVAERKRMGLCSYKQGKLLKKRGLRWQDVTREQAGEIISAIKADSWRTPGWVAREYGA